MGAPLKIPSNQDQRSALIGLGVFASIFIMAGLAVGYFFGLRPAWQANAAQNWVETPCRILSSGVKSHSGKSTTYSIEITYTYQAGGQTLQSHRYDFTFGSTSARAWRAEAVRQNPAGATTICYVNPQDPTEAVLSRSYEHSPAGWIVPGIFSLVGLIMLMPVLLGLVRRLKFGESTLELNDAPVPLGGPLQATVMLERIIQPLEGFTVKLACIHRIVTGGGKSENVQEIPLWANSKQVMSDTGGTIPISFALPEDGAETSALSRRDRIYWQLDITAKVPGLVGYKAQFELPVVKAKLSAEQQAEARKLRASEVQADEQFQLPAHSRIRVQATGGGKEFYFPAMRNLGLVIFLTLFMTVWTAILWVIFHYGAPVIFPIVFGFFELLMLLSWMTACFGSSRVIADNGAIMITKHLFGIGRTRMIPASEISEVRVALGATMGRQVYYNLQIIKQGGGKLTAATGVADAHEAHWLALEMAKCAGVGR